MRIRTIKPEFFRHEELFDAELESGLPLRLAFAGLWCASDREGRFAWRPRTLKSEIMPFDEVDFSRVLDALATREFIFKYASETGVFGCIPSFSRHQVINNRERDSAIPDPNDCKEFDACLTREPRVNHASKEERKGKEGKGKDLSSVTGQDCHSAFLHSLWNTFSSVSRTRSSKKQLKEEWLKTKLQPSDEILESARKWADCYEWTKENGKFASGAHSWIKNRKWEDEPVSPKPAQTTRPIHEPTTYQKNGHATRSLWD